MRHRFPTRSTLEVLETRITPAAVIDLADLNGVNGFKLNGEAGGDFSGGSVSNAGDVNGDGFDDLIIGATFADPNGSFSGASYVVFGKAGGFADNLNLSALDGTNGFKLSGVAASDQAGISVGGAGDLNGDGFDDLIVGANGADANGTDSGASYVVFGKAGGFAANLNLSALNGANGFKLSGVAAGDFSGGSVSGAGDVNGDGFDDLIVGADRADPNGTSSGASYVVFGKAGGFSGNLELSALDGSNGFKLRGAAAGDYSVASTGAGDVNGDGFDDLIVGAEGADPNGSLSGASYVVFGKAGGFSGNLELSALDGSSGFKLSGAAAGDESGDSVSGAGDVNGDGFNDLIIGAPYADPNGTSSGASYVVFGKAAGFSANLNLSALDGTNGFKLSGAADDDRSGLAVNGAGDVNGDGFDDLIIGAYRADPNGNESGASYVVFGKAGGFSANLELLALDGTNGFKLSGVAVQDLSGYSVSGAGDVNGDGFNDLIIGARGADPSGTSSGASYVVFGSAGVQTGKSTVVVTEPDGDVVKITVSGAAFTPQDITRDGNANIGTIDLTRFAATAFAGGKALNVKIGVKIPKGGLGDGTVLVGEIDATGVKLGKVQIKGDLGELFAGTDAGALKLLKISGDLGKPGETTEIKAAINALQVGGDLMGTVIADDFKKVTIGGGIADGTLQTAGGIGSLKVVAKIKDTTLNIGKRIGSMLVLGDVENSTVRVKDAIAKLDVRGDVIDSEITVLGTLGVTKQARAVALQSVKVAGDFVRSKLLAGYDAMGAAVNADVALGSVTIGGNFEASSLVAGAAAGTNGFFGDDDDELITGGGSVVAQIASITIKGSVLGTATTSDHFGLVAEEIAKLKVGGVTQTLTPGPANDLTPLALGGTADVKVREVLLAI